MTVRQLYYTSCEHGRDGIYGFQVNAATPGLPKALEDVAVSVSSYEPAAELLARTPEPEPSEHPVSLGYQRVGEGAVVHRSVYTGRDFTGRRGNYFAHALTLDHPGELAGLLPIDLWRSPVWVEHPVDDPQLPGVAVLPSGSGVGGAQARRLVGSEPERFARVLGAVQVALAGQGRVVACTSGDAEAALWVSAVTRSLPPPLALETTFTTWTGRPDEAGVVLACTTPGIRIGGHPATVVDLTADAAGGTGGRRTAYAMLLADAWWHGQTNVDQLHALAETVRPPLAAADLDDFAAAVRALEPAAGGALADDELIGALRFIALRMPSRTTAGCPAWQRVRQWLAESRVDLAPIAEVLRESADSSTVPPEVLHDYAAALTRAVLGSGATPAHPWWPTLPPDHVVNVTRRFVLPTLLGDGPAGVPPQERVQSFCDLVSADVLRAIIQCLESDATAHNDALVDRLPLELARRLTDVAPADSRAYRLVLMVRARHRDVDPLAALRELLPVARRRQEDLRPLGTLWDDAVPVEDAARLLDSFEPDALVAMELPAAILETLIQDAARGELGADHARVARALRQHHRAVVPPSTEPVLEAIVRGAKFGEQPESLGENDARAALQYVGEGSSLTAAAQDWLIRQVVTWVLDLTPAAHYRVLGSIIPLANRSVRAHYAEGASALGRAAGANELARLAAVWLAIPDNRWRDLLVHGVLPSVFAKRRRDVERIAKVYARRPKDLKRLLAECGGPPDAWEQAWERWRDEHKRPSTMRRLTSAIPWVRRD